MHVNGLGFFFADRVELVGTFVGRKRIFPDREGRKRVRDRRLRDRGMGVHRRFQFDDQPEGIQRVPGERHQDQHSLSEFRAPSVMQKSIRFRDSTSHAGTTPILTNESREKKNKIKTKQNVLFIRNSLIVTVYVRFPFLITRSFRAPDTGTQSTRQLSVEQFYLRTYLYLDSCHTLLFTFDFLYIYINFSLTFVYKINLYKFVQYVISII